MIGQAAPFARPASYWLKHGAVQWQGGEFLNALTSYRHALWTEPTNERCILTYGYALLRLGCAASCERLLRSAVARLPECISLYGLWGYSLLRLGMCEQGLDAIDFYSARPPVIPPEWQEEAYQLADITQGVVEDKHFRARGEGLISIAMARIARGDLTSARRALDRAKKLMPQPTAMSELAHAMYAHSVRNETMLRKHLTKALITAENDVDALVRIALFLHTACPEESRLSRSLLCKAARLTRTIAQETFVCQCAGQMGLQAQVLRVLRKKRNQTPFAISLCFNLSILSAQMGNLSEAVRMCELCRQIDPDDLTALALRQKLETVQELDDAQRAEAVHSLSFYGVLSHRELQDLLLPTALLMHKGNDRIACELCESTPAWDRLLLLLRGGTADGARLLEKTALCLPKEQRLRLCREVLLLPNSMNAVKERAAHLLREQGIPAPYLVSLDGRLVRYDPQVLPPPKASILKRTAFRRIKHAAQLVRHADGFYPWALAMYSRMNEHQRALFLRDQHHVWTNALAAVFAEDTGTAPCDRLVKAMMDENNQNAHLSAIATILELQGGSL